MELKLIDISRDIMKTPPYPGDPAPQLSLLSGIAQGDDCNVALLSTCLHTGTHVDAPLHFLDGGNTVNRYPLDVFIGECYVVEMGPGRITGRTVNQYFPQDAQRILVKSNGNAWFDVTAAEELGFMGLRLIGTDAASVGSTDNEAAAHKGFLRCGTAILENLDLSAVSTGKYFLMAQPLKIAGVEAAPCRAVLLEDYLFWGGNKNIGFM